MKGKSRFNVLFLHVPRERNRKTDMWANMALRNGWNKSMMI